MIAILSNIRSAQNVGSIFRTADAAGIEKLYLCGITPAPLDEFDRWRNDIAKTSLGAEKSVAWEKVSSTINARPTLRLMEKLQKHGYKILVIEQNKNSIPYYQMKVPKSELPHVAVMVGNEVKGLAKTILTHADKILAIPMYGQKESLNVAVAFGIVVFSLVHSKESSKLKSQKSKLKRSQLRPDSTVTPLEQ